MRVAVIGCGSVGGAVREVLRYAHDVAAYDPAKPALGTKRDALRGADVAFVCVPTPRGPEGEHDTSMVREAVAGCERLGPPGLEVAVKSTVPPGLCRELQEAHPLVQVLHVPEFLTHRMAVADFASQRRVLVGSRDGLGGDRTRDAFCDAIPGVEVVGTTWELAALTKLAVNATGAVLVSWWNELAQVAEGAGVRFDELRALILGDGRIGPCWSAVPGPDGRRGFGGACLPKDLDALVSLARGAGVDPTVAEAAGAKNRQVRGGG